MRRLVSAAAVLALVTGLPLLGAALAGRPVAGYLDWPPRTQAVAVPPFDWALFGLGAVAGVGILAPFVVRVARSASPPGPRTKPCAFPAWGWGALILVAVAWATAWGAFGGPEALRRHAFTPLWLGYIGAVNAWTYRRAGVCLLTHRPGTLAGLVVASVVFWWLFEYLNQFVHNWHYAARCSQ